jgi:hypothetical protein
MSLQNPQENDLDSALTGKFLEDVAIYSKRLTRWKKFQYLLTDDTFDID